MGLKLQLSCSFTLPDLPPIGWLNEFMESRFMERENHFEIGTLVYSMSYVDNGNLFTSLPGLKPFSFGTIIIFRSQGPKFLVEVKNPLLTVVPIIIGVAILTIYLAASTEITFGALLMVVVVAVSLFYLFRLRLWYMFFYLKWKLRQFE